ncbi:thiamine biosynthesis protein ThiH [Elizabethkingia sp. HvH-WGS333]|uniref:2-iminoacetate synthase ThiH n=1 Tax=Elizabethkingia TaxID=308865 RepID=UPI0007416601|nr:MULTISPECIES: 2-iminoacetate synthase ThiH [Elizabethkingia]KUG12549.1 thiamine biosynthesis protein ThiH [Elizabethkingia miricola]MCL1657185.1 2-iminoacetate synthase ThiH [Elizabethkingia miricola]MDX8569546.1 2-iminoacetate synthase ThiH [Elizabethkingia sp. HX XZB]OIK47124.1 thiamine biosynthesis protein ThiH [Elizabethkingia sp. HvH-WGS333]
MKTFKNTFLQYDWEGIKNKIYTATSQQVESVLNKRRRTVEDFMVLLSPAAAPYLETMAQMAQSLTQKRFGKVIQMYAPLYLSNECQNICTYCGFSLDNKIRRKTLSNTEIIIEAMALKTMGINHVLLVSGEANKTVGIEYFLNAIKLLRPYFANISIEVQPLSQEEYQLLHDAGVHSVLVYQETYHQAVYKEYHPKGKKSNFDFRLDTPDRIGEAGLHKIGLGVLLGLEDWRVDSFFNALHIDYLQKQYWQTKFSVSFPRLRPAEGIIEPNFIMSDRDLLQLICAYRIWNEDLEISVSTRENENFRNHVIPLGVTTMSAASKTNPGGYAVDPQSLEQFETSDERSMEEVKNIIRNSGYDPVMKDWDKVF